MSNVLRIARKELASFFSSLAAYIFIGVFLATSLFIFFWMSRFFARNIADVRPLFEWTPVLLIFLVSAMTMRMWSEERRSGTIEFLMTAPVRPLHIVLGKFLACLALVGVALALTLPLPLTVSLLGPLDWGPVVGGYVAALALASAYIAIGLTMSSRTDNQVVSLILSTVTCSAFYLVGSDALTSLLSNEGGEILRLLGTGSRFDSIARGVIDLRDIYYYLSIFGVFLVLNLYSLESVRWSAHGQERRRRQWRRAAGLLAVNLVAANFWLGPLSSVRADLTQGHVYSISEASRSYLRQLREPLLIRGYFSAQTHPLLAPLAPRLRDLLKEYQIAGGGKVRVEVIDPAQEPALEAEANRQYNIQPAPFQTSSKYQASVTNSYFNILVKYGDAFTTLGYQDLIEVKQDGEAKPDVDLRDPEYEITRAIKKALNSYLGTGDVLSAIPQPVRLEAYVSETSQLPDPLPQLRTGLEELIAGYKAGAPRKFEATIEDPGAGGGEGARRLQEVYGLRPLAAGLLNPKRFWFHILLRSGDKVEQVVLPESLDKDSLKRQIEASLKRFTPNALHTVALYTPPYQKPMPQLGIAGGGSSYQMLERKLQESAAVEPAELKDGKVPEQTDILFVVAPESLDEAQVFAIDQFLMKGGTVVIASSSRKASMGRNLQVVKSRTGLEDWLAFHGLKLQETMVLDPQNSAFPIPVERDAGGFKVRQIQLMDYPYFVDVRQDGLAGGEAPTAGLGQLTLSWAAPVAIDPEKAKGRRVTRLIESSKYAWASDATDVIPDFAAYDRWGFPEGKDKGRQLLGAMMEGEFTSFFAGKPSPLARDAKAEEPKKDKEPAAGDKTSSDKASDPTAEKEKKASITAVIDRSPASARIILMGSGSFVSDDVLELASAVDHTQYLAPVNFAQNLIDWSLEDRGLLALRSRGGQFSRTLRPVEAGVQAFWEYSNYALALAGLGLVHFIRRRVSAGARRRRLAMLLGTGATDGEGATSK